VTVPTGSVLLNGLPANGTWSLTRRPDGVIYTGTGTSKAISGLEPGIYNFVVTNTVGCTSASSADVLINARPGPPLVVINDPDTVCSISTVNLTLPEITAGSDENLTYTYWLDKDASMPYSTPAQATEGTYYIKGTLTIDDHTAFFTIKPVKVITDQMPVADAGPDQFLVYTFNATMDAQPVEYGTGEWSVISGSGRFDDPRNAATQVIKLSLGRNEFLWTVTNGTCPSATDKIIINIDDLIIPTLITPDMDGKNDYFILRGIENLGTTELVIFDRRGAQVYRSRDYNNKWNGVDYKNNPLPDDTYFYVVKSATGKSINGFVVVRR
jgi:gliding motility-associated-like protein